MEPLPFISHYRRTLEKSSNSIKKYLEKLLLCGNLSLYSGDLSILLFYAHSYLCNGNKNYLQKVYDYLDTVSTPLKPKSSFCSCLAGYAWFICFLHKNKLIELDNDYFEEIDVILFNEMKRLLGRNKYDLLHEGLSIARYFIARQKIEESSYVIDCLEKSKISSDNEIKWISYNSYKESYRYDFGLSHGNAGYLYILGKCSSLNIRKSKCLYLIDGVFNFYIHNEQDFNKCHSYYPSSVDINKYSPANKNEWCRLAWCYGDAGILYSIFNCAELIDNIHMKDYSLSRLEKIADRRSLPDTGIQDASFCHGSSGLCHIFYKLYRKTGKRIFKEATKYWLEITLSLLYSHGNLYYLIEPQTNYWGDNPYLLEGCSGTGIILEELLYQKDFNWDECFMLS